MNEDLKLVLDELRSFKTDVNAKFDEVHNEIRTFKTDVNIRLDKIETKLEDHDYRFNNIENRLMSMRADIKSTKAHAEQAAMFAGELFDQLAISTDERLKKLEAQ